MKAYHLTSTLYGAAVEQVRRVRGSRRLYVCQKRREVILKDLAKSAPSKRKTHECRVVCWVLVSANTFVSRTEEAIRIVLFADLQCGAFCLALKISLLGKLCLHSMDAACDEG